MTREERIRNLYLSSEEESKFQSVYKQYESEEQKKGEQALRWRLEHLIPKSQLLLEKRYSPRQDIKCLFVLVGTSIEPLLLSILTLRPSEKLVLIYSSESKKQKKIIENTLLQKSGTYLIQKEWLYEGSVKLFIEQAKNNIISIDDALITETTPEKVFAEIKSRIASYQANEIGVDITGGKKSMVGGGFLAASINNYHLFYVDFDEYKDSQSVQGTEFIHILPNPYDIYNVREESLIQNFWKRQDFDAVIKVAEETLEKLKEDKAQDYGLQKELYRLRQIYTAANCYREWSKFNYSQAHINAQLTKGIFFDYYIKKHYNILESLSQCQDLRKNAYGAILLALDRWKRGLDSLYVEEFDKSALHFTQAIEILCSYRLFDMSITGKLEGVFNYGINPHNTKQHSPEANGSIKFLFHGINEQNSVKIYNAGISLKWKNGSRFSEIAPYLNIRNDFAHFSCFSNEKISETHKQMSQFQETTKSFITLFITTYQNETDLKAKSFEELQAPFEFAKFTDFNQSN